jgi:hypothetical protein
MYAQGIGVTKDLPRAAALFLKLAVRKGTDSYEGMGYVAQERLTELAKEGVPAAVEWSRRAATRQKARDASSDRITEKTCPYKKIGPPKNQRGFFEGFYEGHGDGIPSVAFIPDNGRIIACANETIVCENFDFGLRGGPGGIFLANSGEIKGLPFELCTRVSVTYQMTQFWHDWPDQRTCERMPELLSITVLKPKLEKH